jgi:TrmH family RNA methyltransferase
MSDIISSLRNEQIKEVRRLHDAGARRRSGKTLIEGPNLVDAALAAGVIPEVVCVGESSGDRWEEAEALGARILVTTDDVLRSISTTQHPRGPVAVVRAPAPDPLRAARTVVLWEIADPGNCGTLIRTAAALGWNVAFVGGVDPWNPKVLRAGAGGHFATRLSRLGDEPVAALRAAGLTPIATLVEGGVSPEAIVSELPLALIIGNEANGLSREVAAACDDVLSLAMPGGSESLNAAVAGSIAMYVLGSRS